MLMKLVPGVESLQMSRNLFDSDLVSKGNCIISKKTVPISEQFENQLKIYFIWKSKDLPETKTIKVMRAHYQFIRDSFHFRNWNSSIDQSNVLHCANSFVFSTKTSYLNKNTVQWLKSTWLLKIENSKTNIYMKTKCLQTKWNAAWFGVGKEKESVMRIESSIKIERCWKIEMQVIIDLKKLVYLTKKCKLIISKLSYDPKKQYFQFFIASKLI